MKITKAALLTLLLGAPAFGSEQTARSESVVVKSGSLKLRGELWRPDGPGPFSAVLFNHGSARASTTRGGEEDRERRLREPSILGPAFVRHGYVFLFLFRRGEGLSRGQGTPSGDLMAGELAKHGPEGRNRIQLRLLEGDEIRDALAGLAFLRSRPDVHAQRLAVVGHSFGGSLALLMAERDPSLRAVVDFAGAAGSWDGSPQLQSLLQKAVRSARVPVLFIHAANDYSVTPGRKLGEEMARMGKPHRVRIYPSVGSTPEEGHRFLYLGVHTWERDVFAFLDEHTR